MDLKLKRVIIADVDETICESCQVISPEMAETIANLIQKGFQFAFISGTSADELQRMISARLKEEHHLLATTGTNYLHLQRDGQINPVYNHSFQEREKIEILAAFKKLINYYNIKSMTTKEDQLQDRDSQITLSAIGRHAPNEFKARYDPDGSKRKLWIEFLQQELGDKYDYKIGGTTSLDVTKKGLDKKWGIKEFAKSRNIDLNSILFFGDKTYPGGNDYPATKIVDFVTVKNPEDTLRNLKELFP